MPTTEIMLVLAAACLVAVAAWRLLHAKHHNLRYLVLAIPILLAAAVAHTVSITQGEGFCLANTKQENRAIHRYIFTGRGGQKAVDYLRKCSHG